MVSRPLLLTVLFAALVITGLLGMHTLTTAHAQHSVAVSTATVTAHVDPVHADHLHAEAATPDTHGDEGCADCGSSGSHHAMFMACVLGLLVTILLVSRVKPALLRVRGSGTVARFLRAVVLPPPRPPSLAYLSISRT
ncbi:DUF6153 family protein [Microbacterium sp. 2FI]|uniref:DUF6153 family protein n=1 Tax=Microbacterium sp. 2FI TaxID=2502193 RepID=UPI0010F59316|nr:DUF6153 family protein [Microbacterium sp. 2FI]